MGNLPTYSWKKEDMKLEFFNYLRVTINAGDHKVQAWRKLQEKLGELWGLLLWVYFMGVPSTVPRSGKPGWPTDGDEACGPSGGPVAVDHEGRSPARISRPDPYRH